MLLFNILIVSCTFAVIHPLVLRDLLDPETPVVDSLPGTQQESNVDKRQVGVLSYADKQRILEAHNNARGNVFPKAQTNSMPNMKWSDELAHIAQAWSSKCIWAHNSGRSSNMAYYVGENMYGTSGSIDVTSAVNAWNSEKQNYDYYNGCKTDKVCGHYTQVIWANTEYVGCGYTKCPTMTIFVCDYGPGGNYVGQKPY